MLFAPMPIRVSMNCMNTTNHKYFIYARKSTDTEDKQVRSIGDQLAEIRELAERLHLDIADIFTESQTAKKPGRPIFKDMLDRIEAGEADGIVAWAPDRLARNWVDAGRIFDVLDRRIIGDLKFVTCYFENTAAGKMNLAQQFCYSKFYVDNLSDVVKRALRQMFKNGLWPQVAPLGYRNDPHSQQVLIDPKMGPLIQKLFTLYASGQYTLAQVREMMLGMGLVNRNGKPPALSNIQYILKNPFYYGLMLYTGEYQEGKHQPLVSKELFDKVQRVMSAKSQPKKHSKLKPYAYRGLFTCPCGCLVTTETHKGHNYLRCTRKKGPCQEPFVREEAVASQIATAIGQVALSADTADWLTEELRKEQAEQIQVIDQKISQARTDVREKGNQINRLIGALADGTLSTEEFRAAKSQAVLEKRDLEEQAVTLEKNRLGWLEPAIRFVKAAKQASFLLTEQNLTNQRDFFKKIGSNRVLSNRTLTWEPRGAWKTLVNAGRFAHPTNGASCDAPLVFGEPDQHRLKLRG